MEYSYIGYDRHKNRVTGKKVYAPVIQCALRKRRSRRWFLTAREAESYGNFWAARATAQLVVGEPA